MLGTCRLGEAVRRPRSTSIDMPEAPVGASVLAQGGGFASALGVVSKTATTRPPPLTRRRNQHCCAQEETGRPPVIVGRRLTKSGRRLAACELFGSLILSDVDANSPSVFYSWA